MEPELIKNGAKIKNNVLNHPKWLPDGSQDHFWKKRARSFINFEVPSGTQKWLKIGEGSWVKVSWELSGSHFGWLSAFFSMLAPFLVNSGSILGRTGSIFEPFW